MAFDLVPYLERQISFSTSAFGPGPRTAGVVDHILKECAEVEATPLDCEEYADLIILAFDGAWRCGASPNAIRREFSNQFKKNSTKLKQHHLVATANIRKLCSFITTAKAAEATPGCPFDVDILSAWVRIAVTAFGAAMSQGFAIPFIWIAVEQKLTKNESRTWPDWRTADSAKAIEHVRE